MIFQVMKRQNGNIALPALILCVGLAVGAFFWWSNRPSAPSVSNASSDALSADADTLHIMAGSELKDLEPWLGKIRKKTGITLDLDYIGTLDGVEAIESGSRVDAAWFSHGKYLTLLDHGKIRAQQAIMLSPVVMGIKKSRAQALGWDTNPVTWADVAKKAAAGELTFAMTNPVSSNSGFTALMGVVAALSGTSDAPQRSDVETARDQLTDFFKGQTLTAGSSGWLADAYLREQGRLDGIINYESVLMQLNKNRALKEPLVLLYPKEGIVTADYPLMLFNNEKREAFEKVIACLKSPDFQKILMEKTDRRPVNPAVGLGDRFSAHLLVELPFPNSNQVVEEILAAYLNELRVPPHAAFVLDTSGSMKGASMRRLKEAMLALSGDDASRTGRFSRFADRERICLIPFSDRPGKPVDFALNPAEKAHQLARFKNYIGSLQAAGGTAIYDALIQAYLQFNPVVQGDGDPGQQHYYSIVLMTDGDNTVGCSIAEFKRVYSELPGAVKQIRVFPLLYDNANEAEMQEIATLTGGRVFDARNNSLMSVFKEIRGYQ